MVLHVGTELRPNAANVVSIGAAVVGTPPPAVALALPPAPVGASSGALGVCYRVRCLRVATTPQYV